MLHTACPAATAALAASRRRARRTTAFGSFRQRTIDRRYCGLVASGSCYALARLQSPFDPFGYAAKVRLAGGAPSSLVWSW